MASIKAIDSTSVHRLHAGQVVLELQGAIKELVENSLDAGATTIDVRIKDNGLDTLEVSDNGSGIAEADWGFIGKKHHTSKLADISALAEVSTFGFRGEALSSLCALCHSVTITTATKETAPMAAVLQLNKDGTTKDDIGRIARPRGTTILLSGLFKPLPVRRKEFERTVKREYAKALSLLYAYALVPASISLSDGRSGVRLKVESVAAGKAGKRTTLLATDGRGSLRSSVTSIWGPKALEGVQDLELDLEVEVDTVIARREGLTTDAQQVKVTGLISSAAWGQGRSSADRQFFYINGRPCDLKQISKAINEVYKSFNTNQVPIAILDFQIPPGSIDINVSPDKRTVFLHSEAKLIASLRAALESFFAPSRSAYPLDGASQTVKVLQPTQSTLLQRHLRQEEAASIETSGSDEELVEEDDMLRDDRTESGEAGEGDASEEDAGEADVEEEDQMSMDEVVDEPPTSTKPKAASRHSSEVPARPIKRTMDTASTSWSTNRSSRSRQTQKASSTPFVPTEKAKLRQRLSAFSSQPIIALESEDDYNGEEEHEVEEKEHETEEEKEEEGVAVETTKEAEDMDDQMTLADNDDIGDRGTDPPPLVEVKYRDEISSTSILGELTLHFDLPRLRQRYASTSRPRVQSTRPRDMRSALSEGSMTAAAGIRNRDMAQAEQALSRVISKADFAKMEVLGQFNKGFIIARLRKTHNETSPRPSDDLFIIDQHASDEKYNFETLQSTTVIKAQALIAPRPLDLTAGDEITAIENLDTLRKNGFEVVIDEEKPPGRGERIRLSAMPVSKETTFDFKDLEQLLHLLSDGARPAGQTVRCAKARSMFAMRACRKSVMIGKSLTTSQMTQLVRNMGTIDQPWNCPHGRPTMRHLTKIERPRSDNRIGKAFGKDTA